MAACLVPQGKCQQLFTSVLNASLVDHLLNCGMAILCVWMRKRGSLRHLLRRLTGTRGPQPSQICLVTPMAGDVNYSACFGSMPAPLKKGAQPCSKYCVRLITPPVWRGVPCLPGSLAVCRTHCV